jgi:hypothetical protein
MSALFPIADISRIRVLVRSVVRGRAWPVLPVVDRPDASAPGKQLSIVSCRIDRAFAAEYIARYRVTSAVAKGNYIVGNIEGVHVYRVTGAVA